MVSSVSLRPNHYELLGLDASASAEQIREAFSKKMSLFQPDPLGTTAQVCIAYETLRDSNRRHEYDRLFGLLPEPKRSAAQWTYPIPQPRWAPFIASAERKLSGELAADAADAAEPHVKPAGQSDVLIDPRLAAIAERVRELSKPATTSTSSKPRPPRLQQPQRQQTLDVSVEELVEQIRAAGRAEKEKLHQAEPGRFDWKRPALTVGAFVIGAGLFGVIAGLSLKGDEAPGGAEAAVSHGLQPRVDHRTVVASAPAAVAGIGPTLASEKISDPSPSLRRSHFASRQQRTSHFAQQIEESLAAQSNPLEPQAETLAADQPVTEAAQPQTANLPLSRNVIARTIERIGYPCGEVASTAAVDGQSPGVFTVTCTSGHSYQATPVSGRYHFRRVRS